MSDEPNVEALQQQATELMRKDVGVWNARWEFLDGEGNIASEAKGTQTCKFVIADRVLQIIIDVPELDLQSVSHRFFKPADRLVHWLSVDKKGDFWEFIEDPITKMARSLPHLNEDGTTSVLRFTSLRETDDESDVLMELSNNEGQNWVPIFRQYRVRQ